MRTRTRALSCASLRPSLSSSLSAPRLVSRPASAANLVVTSGGTVRHVASPSLPPPCIHQNNAREAELSQERRAHHSATVHGESHTTDRLPLRRAGRNLHTPRQHARGRRKGGSNWWPVAVKWTSLGVVTSRLRRHHSAELFKIALCLLTFKNEVEEAVGDGGAGSADGLTVDGEGRGRRRNRCSSSALFMRSSQFQP